MSKRRNLFDDIHGDRADIRTARGTSLVKFDDKPWDDDFKSSSKSLMGSFERCYHAHPGMRLPGTELTIWGGSCSRPEVKDAEVYIGFDSSMHFTQRHWPWKKGEEILFKITDQSAPADPAEFMKLLKWTKKQVDAGIKVHCGCIGGHGRTGTFLAALVSMYGEKDAIEYVRANYCKKAVESKSQVNFLAEVFGVKKAAPRYGHGGYHTSTSSYGKAKGKGITTIQPLSGKGSIWEAPV